VHGEVSGADTQPRTCDAVSPVDHLEILIMLKS